MCKMYNLSIKPMETLDLRYSMYIEVGLSVLTDLIKPSKIL